MAAAASSPSSSPRLPSPPPIAEDQIGPTSPGLSLFEDHGKLTSPNSIDAGAARRIRPGTRAEDMAEGPPLIELQDIDSAFQLTEHLKALYYSYTHPADSDCTVPISADQARQLSQPPSNTSKEIWLYELGRFLIQKTNAIIVGLFADEPPCSPQTCWEMRASEWQYLCAVHDPPKSCSAIDYCCHTLDSAATTLTSGKMFPSRLGLGSGNTEAGNDKVLQQQMKEIANIFRRVYRIYAHAWFSHREMFWRVEAKTGLYIFFKTVCDVYEIMQPENYTIPPEAEGKEPEFVPGQSNNAIPSLLKRESIVEPAGLSSEPLLPEPAGNTVSVHGDTTKRHRHTRSDLSSSLATVIQEEAEDDDSEPLKPGIERQTTALRDSELKAVDEHGTDEESDPIPGLDRAATMKADSTQGSEEGEEATIIGPDTEASERSAEISVTVAEMDPHESPAGEPEEAAKSVGD